jgi:hypothetical protein
MAVFFKENNWFFVTDQTPRPLYVKRYFADSGSNQGCQIFLGTKYQYRENYTK